MWRTGFQGCTQSKTDKVGLASVLSVRVHTPRKNLAVRVEMDSDNEQRYQTVLHEVDYSVYRTCVARYQGSNGMNQESLNSDDLMDPSGEILTQLHNQQLLIVNSRRRNGLILYKLYHAEFAGPGAAVGGVFDLDCQWVLPVGNLSLLTPESTDERQRAYLIRRQWIRLTKQITDDPAPLQRAQKILTQFQQYFDTKTIAQIPDEAFALLVGVFPHTVRKVRHTDEPIELT